MADDFLTREDFIKQYGVDPEQSGGAQSPAPAAAKGLPSLGNAARDVGIGAATALTDVLALPGVVGALGGAAWDAATSDAKFGPSLAKRLRVDDAEARTERHLIDVVNEAKAQVPNMTQAEAQQVLQDYTSSKQYEEFQRSLISNAGVRAAQNIKEGARELAGDTRSDKDRSWTDSALEILGGSLVGIGPQGVAALGGRLGRTAVGSALAKSPTLYNTARVLEAATPLTLPLTPGNVALNTGVGVALDQGLRYATGDTTALSENDSGLGGLATIAGATGAGVAAIAAVRGRANAVAHGAVSSAPPMSPALEQAVKSGAEGGAAFKAGEFADYGGRPTPALGLEGRSIVETARNVNTRYAAGFADEYAIARRMLNDVGGKELADYGETVFSNYSGAGGIDRAHGEANGMMRDFMREIDALSPEWRQRFIDIEPRYQAEVRLRKDEAVTRTEIADLQAAQQANGLTQPQAQRLADLQDALNLRLADDPATRRYFPELSRQDIVQGHDTFLNAAELAGVRAAKDRMMNKFYADMVREGRISPTDAQALKKSDPYYGPIQQDAFDGATGASRFVKSFLASVDPAKREQVVNQAKANTFKTYDAKIETDPSAGRITSPQDPLLALGNYLRNAYTDLYANNARRELLKALTKDDAGNPTKYVADGNIQTYTDRNGRSAFTNAEIRAANSGNGNPALKAMMDAEDTIAVRTNGATTLYRLGDPALAQLLRFEPTMYHGWVWLAKQATDMFKMNTTGVLAPPFAVANAIYDTTFANVLKKPDRAFGPLDTALRKVMSEGVARHTLGRTVDPTSYLALPWHVVAGIGEVAAAQASRYLASDMAKQGPMQAIARSMGMQNYQALVQKMLLATERSKTIQMLDKGIAHSGGLSDMPHALNAFTASANLVPAGVRNTYQFWKDMVSAVHAAPKRQFYAQNMSLLERKYGAGNIPQKEMEKLIYDTRALAGDMTRRSNSKTMQETEAMIPYLAPARNGVTSMARALSDPQAAQYAWPRLMMMMAGTMATFSIMSSWDESSKKEFWLNTPEWMRYRYLFVPRPDVLSAWARGETVPYSNDKVYKIPIGPDLAPFIAGAAAFLRGIGALPNGPIDTAASGLSDFWKMTKDMLPLTMPPAFNAGAALAGAEFDFNGADARGGNAVRMMQANPFRKGPQEEAASPLGETSTLSSRLLAILFGANGAYLAKSGDALQHATKYNADKVDANGLATPRPTDNYAAGLKAATTSFMEAQAKRLPDVPLLWKGDDKQYTGTSASVQVNEAKNHIQSIKGMRDFAQGGTAQKKRSVQGEEGGVVTRFLRDPVLLQIAEAVSAWDRGGQKLGPELGRYAELKKEYSSLAGQRRAIDASYNMEPATRKQKSNALIDRMQENMDQQRMAVMFMEQQLAEKFTPQLAARLGGRAMTMQSLDQMMREAVRE